jgi:hypothetical protein
MLVDEMIARNDVLVGVVLVCVSIGCRGRDPAGNGSEDESEDGLGIEEDTDEPRADTSAGSGPLLDIGGGEGAENMPEEDPEDCPEVEVETDPVIPTVVLLVDQSGSMSDDFSGQPRWEAVYETLMDPDEGVVKPLETTVRFGLTLYSGEDGMCPALTEVAPALDNHAAIDAVYAGAGPLAETPTGDSLAPVAETLAALAEDGPKVIVLATDGEPDTCEQPNPQEGQDEALAAAQAAFAMGIQTYIISVGAEISHEHLQEMANAGVGLDPMGPEQAPYYQALDAGDLLGAFDDIIGSFISCTLELDGVVDLEQACEGTVFLDDQELECNVDWQLPDSSTLQLIGEACDILKNGDPHTVTATWPCDAVEIE